MARYEKCGLLQNNKTKKISFGNKSNSSLVKQLKIIYNDITIDFLLKNKNQIVLVR